MSETLKLKLAVFGTVLVIFAISITGHYLGKAAEREELKTVIREVLNERK